MLDRDTVNEAIILFTKCRQRRKLPLPEFSMLPEPSIKKAKSRRARQTVRRKNGKENGYGKSDFRDKDGEL